jgi:thioester reductase-like protein
MVSSSRYSKVYCFVRGEDPIQRIVDSLRERDVELNTAQLEKVAAFRVDDWGLPDFGLGEEVVEQLKREVTLILHIGWPVNFNIALQTFEPDLAGLHSLIELSLQVRRPEPAQLFFASTVSVAFSTPAPAVIQDGPIRDFSQAARAGYSQSKLVAEHMVLKAAQAGARCYVARIGQIVGDTKSGAWNDREFLPSMIRSALTTKTLPALNEVPESHISTVHIPS